MRPYHNVVVSPRSTSSVQTLVLECVWSGHERHDRELNYSDISVDRAREQTDMLPVRVRR